jgi:hypothetical protein
MKKDDKRNNPYKSPIPPHLTPEEREIWEEDLRWQEEEVERRREQGMYDQKPRKKTIGWKSIANLFREVKIW